MGFVIVSTMLGSKKYMVAYSDPSFILKNRIAKDFGIPIKSQKLFYNKVDNEINPN